MYKYEYKDRTFEIEHSRTDNRCYATVDGVRISALDSIALERNINAIVDGNRLASDFQYNDRPSNWW